METRPISTVSQAAPPPSRPEPLPVREAVRTDLAVPQAVSAMAGAEQTSANLSKRPSLFKDARTAAPDSAPPLPAPKESLMEADKETGDLIYKVIDPETRKIVTQYPAEALLRLRAYIRAEDQQTTAALQN